MGRPLLDDEGVPLWVRIEECMRLLDVALLESRERGRKAAQAKADYYTVKAKAAFRMREEGHTATFIAQAIKGEADVNDAMLDRDIAEVEYENAKEARNCYKKKLDTMREEYQREWGRAGMEG